MNETILQINDLNVEFPILGGIFQRENSKVHAVKNVNLNLMNGKTIGVVGESGSGKSTLGKAIINVLKLTAQMFEYMEILFFIRKQMML